MIVTGILRPKTVPKFRLAGNTSSAPIIELQEIQRLGEDSSKVSLGQIRDPGTLRKDYLLSGLALLQRDRPAFGTRVTFSGRLGIIERDGEILISDQSKFSHGQARLSIPLAQRARFTTFQRKDNVIIVGTVINESDSSGYLVVNVESVAAKDNTSNP